jgi:hypothetical protein
VTDRRVYLSRRTRPCLHYVDMPFLLHVNATDMDMAGGEISPPATRLKLNDIRMIRSCLLALVVNLVGGRRQM